MTLVATLDAGGSGVKLGVVSLETWRTLASVRREYAPLTRQAGLCEWDPGAWWAVIEGALAEAVSLAGEPPERYTGLTCTGMRIPFVLVDEQHEPVAPGVLVPDTRGRVHAGRVREAVGGRRAVPGDGSLELAAFRASEGAVVRSRATRAVEAHALGAAVLRLVARAPLRRRGE